MAAYICKGCDIEGQDLEVAPGRVLCWNCEGQAVITARIVVNAAYQGAGTGSRTRNALLRDLRWRGERGLALLTQRWAASSTSPPAPAASPR